ncbi:hypothetical protein [Arenivirga flava]|uniref:Glycosyltransferase n=1 Tax=Arenivirga flava TaxID=1930060 RepID=A0AA37UK10_9MICO|nr:hypothetical protein [Arenivirga flava]GMA28676.1 hypothetical protein GCM10025874_19290 [Arenivirga flava]
MTGLPAWVLPAEPRHGVTLHAERMRRLLRPLAPDQRVATLDALPDGPVHVQFTDRLWGSSPEEAAERFRGLAACRAVTATLHDVPQPSDGEGRFGRRAACYAAVIAAAAGVVCSSEHEAQLLREHVGATGPVAVIPLPLLPAPPAERPEPRATVGLLGYFYPGKGHAEALAAMAAAGLAGELGIEVLGAPSRGHEGELDDFVRSAQEAGFEVEVTGYLPDDELLARSRETGVPVIAHQHISASGSLNSWLEAGRRPIVLRGRYTEEMDRLRPGTLTLADDDALGAAIAAAASAPHSTWQETAMPAPTTARALLDWWRGLAP